MVVGVIYRYISPVGKSYIGQTTNEGHRRATWSCTRYRYAGTKINNARLKYGPNSFKYEVVHRKYYFTEDEAKFDLNFWEIFYIGFYNSCRHGYNSTFGGDSYKSYKRAKPMKSSIPKGYTWDKDVVEKRRKSIIGIRHTEAASIHSKELRRVSGIGRTVYQFSLSGELIKGWRNISEAAETLFEDKKYVSNIHRAAKTDTKYKGFYWRFENNFTVKPRKLPTKRVIKISLSGEILETFDSVKEAAASINRNVLLISRCCNNHITNAYGYKWKFEN